MNMPNLKGLFLGGGGGGLVELYLNPSKVYITNSRSTFEFPSRANLSGPSLYCIARTLGKYSIHSIGLAGAIRLTRSDFRFNLLLLKGQGYVIAAK